MSQTLDLKSYIRDVPDFPKPGILFRDVTPLLRDHGALAHAIDRIEEHARRTEPDLIVGIESRGFIFAVPLALRLGAGFVPIRKPGKLPWMTHEQTYELEYGAGTLEMHKDAIEPGQRVLVADDLLATGGTAAASSELIGKAGGVVAGALFLVELTALAGRAKLGDYPIESLIQY